MEGLVGGSRSRVPPRRRYADAPAATLLPISACANSRTVAVPPLCSVLRYAHFRPRRGSRAGMVHGVHFEANALYVAVYKPVQHRFFFGWPRLRLNPFPHPHHQAYRHARYVNACGRPPRCCGPSDDCRCACRSDWRHRDGEHQKAALRADSKLGLRPASNREQGLIFASVKS